MDDLGSFFKNKLSRLEETDGHWDKPDIGIKNTVLASIPVAEKPKKKRFFLTWIGWISLLSILSGGYIWSLHIQNNQLKKILTLQTKQLENANISISNLKTNTNSKQGTRFETTSSTTTNQHFFQKKNSVSPFIQEQRKTIFNKINEPKKLLETSKREKNNLSKAFFKSNNSQQKQETWNDSTKKKDIVIQPLAIIPFKPLRLALITPQLLNDRTDTLQPKNIENQSMKIKEQFEIGLEYGLMSFHNLFSVEYKDLKTGQHSASNKVFSMSKGLMLSYSSNENWWIKTGIRTSNLVLEQKVAFLSTYDKTGEYIKSNGETGNDLTLNYNNTYTETENNISLTVPQDVQLETGDQMTSELTNYQKSTWLQVPIGLEYRFGGYSFSWGFQGGLQWNSLFLGEYWMDGKIKVNEKELFIDKIEIAAEKAQIKQFWEAYLGLNFNYRLSHNWLINANWNYRYDFNSIKYLPNAYLINHDFRIGLSYKFISLKPNL